METENTVGSRIMKRDPEAFEMLKFLIMRPGMYVGKVRLDYVEHLFTGYYLASRRYLGQNDKVDFLPSMELQYWLLHTQSAAIDGSISGTSLFYRCFGSRKMAFDYYKIFLDADIPDNPECVYSEILNYTYSHNIVDYSYFEEGLLKEELPPDYYQKSAQTVIDIIKEMINNAGLTYDELKVYIRKERLFNQVRFMFYGSEGWKDDSVIIANSENHERLVAMHAHVKGTSAAALRGCGCHVQDTMNYDDGVFPSGDMFTDEIAFITEYLQWRSKICL